MFLTGVAIFLGLLLVFVKLPRRTLLRLLRYDLVIDLFVTLTVLAIHFGTFSGVMAATVAGLLTSSAARSEDIAQVLERSQELQLQALSDALPLLESGLDSLCFAIIVAELEDNLGLDPFSDADEVFFPVTFGDFVALYETAALKKAA